VTIVVDVWRMYHECNLVHGDLSEYNLLWHEGRAVIIDVSQSVEHAHPYANDFLRKDISNITDFFRKKGMLVLSNYQLFLFVTDKDVKAAHGFSSPTPAAETESVPQNSDAVAAHVFELKSVVRALLDRHEQLHDAEEAEEQEADEAETQAAMASIRVRQARGGSRRAENDDDAETQSTSSTSQSLPDAPQQQRLAKQRATEEALIEEAVFLQSYIPTSLSDLSQSQPHLEMARLQGARGGREPVYAQAVQRMLGSGAGGAAPGRRKAEAEGGVSGDGDDDGSDDDDDDDDNEDEDENEDEGDERGPRDENGKYRKVLPPRDLAEARAAEKEARKDARKAAKAEAALRRQTKIPKHVKKRAVKTSKVKK
jgi:RIO kinase 1